MFSNIALLNAYVFRMNVPDGDQFQYTAPTSACLSYQIRTPSYYFREHARKIYQSHPTCKQEYLNLSAINQKSYPTMLNYGLISNFHLFNIGNKLPITTYKQEHDTLCAITQIKWFKMLTLMMLNSIINC